MKRILSVWALLARMTVPWLLGVLALMAIAETVLLQGAAYPRFETAVSERHVDLVFLASYGATVVLLARSLFDRGGKSGCTLQRLQISEKQVFLLHTFHNLCCLLILWGAQAGLVLALGQRFYALHGGVDDPQGLLLAFYRSGFLHGVLPLSDTLRWVHNCTCALAAAATASRAALLQRRGTSLAASILTAALTALWFSVPTASNSQDWVMIFGGAAVFIGYLFGGMNLAHSGTSEEEITYERPLL